MYENLIMIRVVILLLLSYPLFALAPHSPTIGEIAIEVETGSISEKAMEAMKKEYTEEWLDDYAKSSLPFAAAYSEYLNSILPMENPVLSKEKNNALNVLDLSTGNDLSLIFSDGDIVALQPII